jgi:hypothetical protein
VGDVAEAGALGEGARVCGGAGDGRGAGRARARVAAARRRTGRASRRVDGDRRLFAAAAVAGLALTPIGWSYDYVVLLVPLALVSRGLSRQWLIPIVFWLPVAVDGIGQASAPCCRPSGAALPSPACYAALLGLTAVVTIGPTRRAASRASSGRARAAA